MKPRPSYTMTFQVGLVFSLLILITVFRVQIQPEPIVIEKPDEPELPPAFDTPITEFNKPIPPARPVIPMVVSNDDPLIEDGQFIFDDYELSGPIALPPKPDAAENEPEIITFAEHMPAPIGGMEAIYRHVTYPEIARKAGIEGRVVLQFIVDERGNVVNPIVIRGIGGGCDEAALEAIKNVKFTPGLQRGRPVKVQYQLPIVFRLQ